MTEAALRGAKAVVVQWSPRSATATPRQRKSQLGQFMTPPSVAEFMASLFEIPPHGAIRLLVVRF